MLEEVERSFIGVELRRFSKEEGVFGVFRMTWHLPSPGPGAGCPLQGRLHIKLVWTDITLSIFKETPVIPPLDYPYERPVKRNFQKSFVFLCL